MSYIEVFLIVLSLLVAAFVAEFYLQRRKRERDAERFRAFDNKQHGLADRLGPPKSQPLTRRLPSTGNDALGDAEELRSRSAA